MADRWITYDDFSGGYAGELPSWRLSPTQWYGLNVLPAVDGSLIPRSGLVRFQRTGIANGQLAALGWTDGGAGPDKAWYVQGTGLYSFDPYSPESASAVAAATGALASAPTRVIHWWDEAGVVWMTSYGDQLYKYDLTANTLTAVPDTTGGPAGRCIVSWGSFLITGGPPNYPARIYWSDGEGLDDWPNLGGVPPEGANYADIGSLNSAVTGLYVLRGQLIVAKDDGSWWVITGDLSTNEFPEAAWNVRNVITANTPLLEPQHGATIGGQAVWMVTRSSSWPSWMNGSTISDLNYLKTDLVPTENGGGQPNLNVTRLTAPSDLLIAAGSVGTDRLMLKDSVWSHHQFSIPSLEWTAPMVDGLVLTSDGGTVGTAPKFYVWSIGLDDPPDDSAPLQSVTDDGSEYPTFWEGPEWVNEQGVEVLARLVTVDFRRVDQGASGGNQGFALQIASTRRTRDEAGTRWSDVQRWAGPGQTVDQDRVTIMVGDQGNGAGFRARLFDIRGVAIQRVSVKVLEESERVA